MTDHDTALSILTRVAAKLASRDGLTDPAADIFRSARRSEIKRNREEMHRRGCEIAKAFELLRKDAK